MPALRTAARAQQSSAANGFNKYTEDYAAFCAKPPHERVFYALVDGKIVSEKLNDQGWKSTDWGKPPELPVPAGSWDGVPMESPIAGLGGDGPYLPTWDSLLAIRRPGMVSRREIRRSGRTGVRSASPKRATGTRATCTWRVPHEYKYQLQHYGLLRRSDIRTFARSGRCSTGSPTN